MRRITFMIAAVALVTMAAPIAAPSLPRLADEVKIAKSAESPGQVVFNHTTHVDSAKPECTSCHPRDFRILKASVGTKGIVHKNFEQGRQCGRCHNGKQAFSYEADCTICHRG